MPQEIRSGPRSGMMKWTLIFTAGICLAGLQPLAADGGVTFTDIAAGGGAGITYERFPTPDRQAVQDALIAASPLPTPIPGGYNAITPQKPRGTPGVALFDYDNDGDLDIYVTNGPGHANSLYQSQLVQTGTVTFVDVAAAAGVTATAQDGGGVCFGDLDNDGFQDLYVTGVGEPNILFRNNGNGTFSDITAAAGVGAGSFHHSGCAMGDFNGDGRLDLAVANTYDDWHHRRPMFLLPFYPAMEQNQLFFRNAGLPGIKFTDVSATSGIQQLDGLPGGSFTWAIAAVDYDGDGATDIVWADTQTSATPPNPADRRGWMRLLHNDGNGHFTDMTRVKNQASGIYQGISFGDFNCDGNADIGVASQGFWIGGHDNDSRWLLGDGHGGFTDPRVGALQGTADGWGIGTFDYDNDADQDLVFYGGEDLFTVLAMSNPGSILQNQGCSAIFTQDLGALQTDHRLRQVNGLAVGDVNNDSFPDIVSVARIQIEPFPSRLFIFPISGLPPIGSPLDNIALVNLVLGASTPRGFLLYLQPPTPLPNGNLAIEINSADNGNGGVKVKLLGTSGLLADGKTNRDGIGATIRFTPDGGSTTLVPVAGGGSHASQSSLIAGFGLDTAAKGTVEVRWPSGVKNVLFDVAAGETVKVPEIPCNYDPASFKNFGLFNACVTKATDTLRNRGLITNAERDRIRTSARRVFGQ